MDKDRGGEDRRREDRRREDWRKEERRGEEREICSWNDLNAVLGVHIPHRQIIGLSAQNSSGAISPSGWESSVCAGGEVA